MPDSNHIIFDLSDKELAEIIDDISLLSAGFKFYYAVDTYDFIHFFAPYLGEVKFTSDTLNSFSKEAIAYEDFFSDNTIDNIILLNEYKNELLSVKNYFLSQIKISLELSKNISLLTKEIKKIIELNRKTTPTTSNILVANNLNVFFLLLILSEKKEQLKDQNLFTFLQKKIHITKINTGDPEFDELLTELFADSHIPNFIESVYEEFVNLSFKNIYHLDESYRYKYLRNSYSDISAIKRLIYVNEKLYSENAFGHKTLFFYLSSTPFKSDLLFTIIDKLYKETFSSKKLFQVSNGNIHRNIQQVFILNNLVKQYSENVETAIKIIELVRDIKRNGQEMQFSTNSETTNHDNILILELRKLLAKYASIINNHFYNSMIKSYEETLNNIIKSPKKYSDQLSEEIMSAFSRYFEETQKEEGNFHLLFNISRFEKISLLREVIFQKHENYYCIKVNFGNDIVKFNFHHLPFLLFLFDKNAQQNFSSFYLAMNKIIDIENEKEINIDFIVTFLSDLLINLGSHRNNKNYQFLILIFLDLLIIDPSNKSSNNVNSELELINILYIERHNLSVIQRSAEENEIAYVLLWLYRRNNMFVEAQRLIDSISTISDPRLSHGIALIEKARYYYEFVANDSDKKRTEDNYEILLSAINHLTNASKGYKECLLKNKNNEIRQLIVKNLIAIDNSLADCFIAKYRDYKVSISNSLNIARKHVENLRKRCESLNIPYDNLSIPKNTESELEFLEALNFYNSGDNQMAQYKLKSAKRNYIKSIAKTSMIHERFKDIGAKIEDLELKIKEKK